MSSTSPLTSRKLDLVYLVFFAIHIPVILLIDIVPFYPPSLVPSISVTTRKFYIDTYRDRFFIHPPSWFTVYLFLEIVYHLPVSLWMLRGLYSDHVLVPVNLLVFGLETGITTLTCLTEMLSWEQNHGYKNEEIRGLGEIYVPYLCVGILMIGDGFWRVRKQVMGDKVKTS